MGMWLHLQGVNPQTDVGSPKNDFDFVNFQNSRGVTISGIFQFFLFHISFCERKNSSFKTAQQNDKHRTNREIPAVLRTGGN